MKIKPFKPPILYLHDFRRIELINMKDFFCGSSSAEVCRSLAIDPVELKILFRASLELLIFSASLGDPGLGV